MELDRKYKNYVRNSINNFLDNIDADFVVKFEKHVKMLYNEAVEFDPEYFEYILSCLVECEEIKIDDKIKAIKIIYNYGTLFSKSIYFHYSEYIVQSFHNDEYLNLLVKCGFPFNLIFEHVNNVSIYQKLDNRHLLTVAGKAIILSNSICRHVDDLFNIIMNDKNIHDIIKLFSRRKYYLYSVKFDMFNKLTNISTFKIEFKSVYTINRYLKLYIEKNDILMFQALTSYSYRLSEEIWISNSILSRIVDEKKEDFLIVCKKYITTRPYDTFKNIRICYRKNWKSGMAILLDQTQVFDLSNDLDYYEEIKYFAETLSKRNDTFYQYTSKLLLKLFIYIPNS
jgi:hypothetical protein